MAEHGSIRIPDYAYKERIQRAANLIKKEGIDNLWRKKNVELELFRWEFVAL